MYRDLLTHIAAMLYVLENTEFNDWVSEEISAETSFIATFYSIFNNNSFSYILQCDDKLKDQIDTNIESYKSVYKTDPPLPVPPEHMNDIIMKMNAHDTSIILKLGNNTTQLTDAKLNSAIENYNVLYDIAFSENIYQTQMNETIN